MFDDQNLMGPNLTLIAEDFGMTDVKDQYLGGLVPLVFWLLGGAVARRYLAIYLLRQQRSMSTGFA